MHNVAGELKRITHAQVSVHIIGKRTLNTDYQYQGFSFIGSRPNYRSDYWYTSNIRYTW